MTFTQSPSLSNNPRILTNYLILSTVSKYDLVTANLANAKTHNTTNNIHYQLMPGGLTCLVFSNGVTNTGKITHHDHFLKNNHTSPHWSFNVMSRISPLDMQGMRRSNRDKKNTYILNFRAIYGQFGALLAVQDSSISDIVGLSLGAN